MKGLISFFRSFYDHSFHRHFRRPPDFDLKERKFRIQFTVETPKNLYLHVHRNSGNYPCLISTYDHGSIGNLTRKDPEKMLFDRVFLDFDVRNTSAQKIKKELQSLRTHSLVYKKHRQEELQQKLQDLIIDERIAYPAIQDAKHFAKIFKENFGQEIALFFSGCKGCHAYSFFEATKFIDLNKTIYWFAKKVKDTYKYETLDLSVTKDPTVRLSRVPYSKHQYSLLSVVPFSLEDSYEEIIEKALNVHCRPFEPVKYLTTDLPIHLKKIDKILMDNEKIKAQNRNKMPNQQFNVSLSSRVDHRLLFKNFLGEPVRSYPDKEYVMYRCPFPDHPDHNPSFRVQKVGYNCYGCLRQGNYWQFLKDFHGWSNEQVKKYLKSSNSSVM